MIGLLVMALFSRAVQAAREAVSSVTGHVDSAVDLVTPAVLDDVVDGVLSLPSLVGPLADPGAIERAAEWLIDNPEWALVMGAVMASSPIGGTHVAMGIHADQSAGLSDQATAGNALIRAGQIATIAGLGYAPLLAVGAALATTGNAVKAGEAGPQDAMAIATTFGRAWASSDGEADGAIQRTIAADADDPDDVAAAAQLWAESGDTLARQPGPGGGQDWYFGGAGGGPASDTVVELDDYRRTERPSRRGGSTTFTF